MSTNGFGKKIADFQDEILAQQDAQTNDIDFVRQRLFTSPQVQMKPSRNWFPVLGVGFAAAAACAVILVIMFRGEPEKLVPQSHQIAAGTLEGQWLYASDSDKVVSFSDESSILLEKGATARVLDEDKHSVHFLLEQGQAKVSVVHHDDTNWVLDVGPYKVKVVGTAFSISWIPSTQVFSLTLDEGAVKVSGPMVENGRMISRKETFTARVSSGTVEIQSAEPVKLALDTEDSSGDLVDGASLSQDSTVKLNKSSAKTSTLNKKNARQFRTQVVTPAVAINWQGLNRIGKFQDVVKDAKQLGIASVMNSKSAADLMALGDAARLVKEWNISLNSYKSIRRRFPGNKNSSMAAYSIGKISFDVKRDYRAATKWLELYLQEVPQGRLSREALGRLMEARLESGNVNGAKSAAQQYLKQYPKGPHAKVASQISNQ